jgi:hypothetical protein
MSKNSIPVLGITVLWIQNLFRLTSYGGGAGGRATAAGGKQPGEGSAGEEREGGAQGPRRGAPSSDQDP